MRRPTSPSPAELYDRLFSADLYNAGFVAAIVDPTTWPDLPDLLSEHCPEWYILYTREISGEIIQVLPWIIRLEPGNIFTDQFLQSFGKRRNIFLHVSREKNARLELTDVVAHLHDFPHVMFPGNTWNWFRYYDPAIFCSFMETATAPQKCRLFGTHITHFFAESVWEGTLNSYPAPPEQSEPERPIFIKAEQKEFFDECHYRFFLNELAEHILNTYAPEGMSDIAEQAIIHDVHKTAALAQTHGAYSKLDCLEFVKIGAMYGFTCYNEQPIVHILQSPGGIQAKIEAIAMLLEQRANNSSRSV